MKALIGITFDRSGSMASMWVEAKAAYKALIEEQQKLDDDTYLVMTVFDNEIEHLFLGKKLSEIADAATLDGRVEPRGLTALVDASLATIKKTEEWLNNNKSFDGKVYQVIITDGYENASEARPHALKEKIAEKEAAGWEFIYLAANVDLDATARSFGIDISTSLSYDKNTILVTYARASAGITRSRQLGFKIDLSGS